MLGHRNHDILQGRRERILELRTDGIPHIASAPSVGVRVCEVHAECRRAAFWVAVFPVTEGDIDAVFLTDHEVCQVTSLDGRIMVEADDLSVKGIIGKSVLTDRPVELHGLLVTDSPESGGDAVFRRLLDLRPCVVFEHRVISIEERAVPFAVRAQPSTEPAAGQHHLDAESMVMLDGRVKGHIAVGGKCRITGQGELVRLVQCGLQHGRDLGCAGISLPDSTGQPIHELLIVAAIDLSAGNNGAGAEHGRLERVELMLHVLCQDNAVDALGNVDLFDHDLFCVVPVGQLVVTAFQETCAGGYVDGVIPGNDGCHRDRCPVHLLTVPVERLHDHPVVSRGTHIRKLQSKIEIPHQSVQMVDNRIRRPFDDDAEVEIDRLRAIILAKDVSGIPDDEVFPSPHRSLGLRDQFPAGTVEDKDVAILNVFHLCYDTAESWCASRDVHMRFSVGSDAQQLACFPRRRYVVFRELVLIGWFQPTVLEGEYLSFLHPCRFYDQLVDLACAALKVCVKLPVIRDACKFSCFTGICDIVQRDIVPWLVDDLLFLRIVDKNMVISQVLNINKKPKQSFGTSRDIHICLPLTVQTQDFVFPAGSRLVFCQAIPLIIEDVCKVQRELHLPRAARPRINLAGVIRPIPVVRVVSR